MAGAAGLLPLWLNSTSKNTTAITTDLYGFASSLHLEDCHVTDDHIHRMERIALLGRLHGKTKGAAIAMRSRRAIDRLSDGKRASRAAVKIPVFVSHAQRAQQRIVELAWSMILIQDFGAYLGR
jgi:hypothetical protein